MEQSENLDPRGPTASGGQPARWAFLGLLTAVLLMAGWSIGRRGDTSLATVQAANVVRIGYAVEPPYALIGPGATVSGEAPEIARRIAARLGIARIDWRLMDFGELIERLELGEIDVIAAGMFITPERKQRVAFSIPTFQVRDGLLVRRGNPQRLHAVSELKGNPAIRIAVLRGSFEETNLRQAGLPPAQLIAVPDARSARAMVAAGRADGLMLSQPSVRWMADQDSSGRFEAVAGFESDGQSHLGAFAFRREDVGLREAWNRELRRLIGSAEHRALAATFKLEEAELPVPATPRP